MVKLISYNLTKISAERYEGVAKELKINTSINLNSIEEAKNDLFKTKEIVLNIKFKYKLNYDPKIADLIFEGNLGVMVESKKAKEILKNQKDNKIDEEFKIIVFNLILRKVSLKALQLEEELGLPPHFNLPSLKSDKKE